jgi:hypothetical protein
VAGRTFIRLQTPTEYIGLCGEKPVSTVKKGWWDCRKIVEKFPHNVSDQIEKTKILKIRSLYSKDRND